MFPKLRDPEAYEAGFRAGRDAAMETLREALDQALSLKPPPVFTLCHDCPHRPAPNPEESE